MKVLWICNSKPSGIDMKCDRVDTGGWMTGTLKGLKEYSDFELVLVYPNRSLKEVSSFQVGNIVCYEFPAERNLFKYDYVFYPLVLELLMNNQFDCIHIWGTEFPHCLATVDAAEKGGVLNKVVIWIQGLCSICAKHYLAGIPLDMCRKKTFRDFVRNDGLIDQKKKFELRGKFEIEAIKKCKHICGRTEWDRGVTRLYNPKALYHKCNETMRPLFYDATWNYSECERYSIFFSQATYPLKGFHFLLDAIIILKQKYGNKIHVYVAGDNILARESLKQRIRLSGYAKFLIAYIKKNNLEGNIYFLGSLSEKEMVKQYKKANVFVLASEIENSPNSLGEAMLVGTPSIASDVGGVRNMMEHRSEGLVYPSKENYMLASYIDELFSNSDLCKYFSNNARKKARSTHSSSHNAKRLMEIYRGIAKDQ